MTYGIVNLSIIPCRAEPSDKAEMVTQLLFGEIYWVIDEQPNWIKIKNQYDGYESWICRKQFFEISGNEFDEMALNEFPVVGEICSTLSDQSLVTMGATLPYFHQTRFRIRQQEFKYTSSVGPFDSKELIPIATKFLNTPYLWGGRSPFGIDCSGFTQVVFKLIGIKLPRDAYQQADEGYDVSFLEMAEPCDVAFFDNADGKIIHVGILLNNHQIIHASGKVRIDKIDHQGIYNVETKSYSHQLRLIKRII
jgi:gamma-D-glutamyl-L-lysine dipeptidyl-peptidase